MYWEAWLTLATIVLMAVALVRNLAGPDTILLGGLTILMTLGLFSDGYLPTPETALAGFGNKGLVTIAVLFVVSAGLTQTGAMSMVVEPLLGRPRNVAGAQLRLMGPVAVLSAFLNNTPIVAMFMPVVSDWCKKTRISPSKLFIPLSYAAIMGGSCTLIGTATNVVVHGELAATQVPAHDGTLLADRIGMFTITLLAGPVALLGIGYVLLASRALLPDRQAKSIEPQETRRFTVEMLVEPNSPIDGKTVEDAGLRHLPGLYLIEIERSEERIVAVGPEQILRGDDRLIFAGIVDSVVDLQRIRGLVPATDQVFKLSAPRANRRLVEAVVGTTCPLVGKSIREGRFRTIYNAAVIAVHRHGEHLNQKIGDIVLEPGDTLLIDTHPRFVDQHRNSGDFFLVSAVAGFQPVRHEKAWLALGILTAMVAAATFTEMALVNAALIASGLMVIFRCCSTQEARDSIQWRVLLVIGAAIGIGTAVKVSGLAEAAGTLMVDSLSPFGHRAVLFGICIIAMVFASMIQPVATALLLLPIAMNAAQQMQVSALPFAIALMMIPAASFATPMAYQTNLMVYGPGGYRFTDYLRIGLPLNALVIVMTVVFAPVIWPFKP